MIRLKTLISRWDRLERIVATITIALAFILTFVEVIARFVFNTSFYWAKEYIIFFTVWSTFLGASQVLKTGKHIRLSVVVDLLPARWQIYMDVFNSGLGIIFSLLLTVSGFLLTVDALDTGVTSTSLAKTPLWMPYSIMLIGGVLFSVRFLELFSASLDKIRRSATEEGGR
jgi:C4-dicarboxylate transporter DctQ subunit